MITLWKSREAIRSLVVRDLKVRYKSSVLGFFWSFCKPLLMMLVLLFVFSQIIRFPLRHENLPFALHLLAGILAWTLFVGALMDGMHSLLANSNIIKKTNIPKEIFPFSTVIAHTINFLLGLVVLLGVLVVCGIGFRWSIVLLPVIITCQIIFMLALALLLSALNTLYRDVASIMEIVVTAWFYVTPIIYPAYMAYEKLQAIHKTLGELYFILNPMAPIIVAFRRVLYAAVITDPEPEMPDAQLIWYMIIAFIISLGLLCFSFWLFKKLASRVVDEL